MSKNVQETGFLLDFDQDRFRQCHHKLVNDLIAARTPSGHWEGHLSSSALSTATAITALALLDRHTPDPKHHTSDLQQAGLKWLNDHVNEDGGWGDTSMSFSNISTTALVWAAFGAVKGGKESYPDLMHHAETWLQAHAASLSREDLSKAITKHSRSPSSPCVHCRDVLVREKRLGKPWHSFHSNSRLFLQAGMPL